MPTSVMVILAMYWVAFIIGLFCITAVFIDEENKKGGDD
jgi:hypothetical protein